MIRHEVYGNEASWYCPADDLGVMIRIMRVVPAPDDALAMAEAEAHRALVEAGCSHLPGVPHGLAGGAIAEAVFSLADLPVLSVPLREAIRRHVRHRFWRKARTRRNRYGINNALRLALAGFERAMTDEAIDDAVARWRRTEVE